MQNALPSLSSELRLINPQKSCVESLDTCDNGCPNKHYSKPIDDGCTSVPRLGHPLLCHISEGCTSTIRIFRAASVHYDKLRTLRQPIDTVRRNNEIISTIDRALYSASFKLLLKTLGISDEPVATVVVFNKPMTQPTISPFQRFR